MRELENTIERAMVLAETRHASAPTICPSACARRGSRPAAPDERRALDQEDAPRAIEEILIRRALQKTKGNRTRAAEVLEISHRALLYKIKDYKITDL